MHVDHAHAAVQKAATRRTATASALVRLNATAFQAISADGVVAKGSVFTVAQLAGRHWNHSDHIYDHTSDHVDYHTNDLINYHINDHIRACWQFLGICLWHLKYTNPSQEALRTLWHCWRIRIAPPTLQ